MANCLYYKNGCTLKSCSWLVQTGANKECTLGGKLASKDLRGEDGLLLQLHIVKVKGHKFEIEL